MILPVATLVLTLYAENTLIVRSSMLDTLGEDYILTARAKGLNERRIISSYALRNAMLPTITQVALSLGSDRHRRDPDRSDLLLAGHRPQPLQRGAQRDYPMLQGGFLVITVTVVLLNYLADLFYYNLDPRLTR